MPPKSEPSQVRKTQPNPASQPFSINPKNMVTNALVPTDDGLESRELAERVNRDMLPIDSFEVPQAPASQEVAAVIGSMKKFVERLN